MNFITTPLTTGGKYCTLFLLQLLDKTPIDDDKAFVPDLIVLRATSRKENFPCCNGFLLPTYSG
jgi:hypothetical protein